MVRKKKSGHQYRTERLAKEKSEKKQYFGLQKWLKTSNSKSESDNENVCASSSKDGLDGEDNAYDMEVEVNAPATKWR